MPFHAPIAETPSETQFRDILDPINPELLRPTYDSVLRELQRGKELQKFTILDGYYPVALDGTGYFSSSKTRCSSCLVKKIKSKTKDKDNEKEKKEEYTYHHQMLGAAIIHPHFKQVIPLFPEPITNKDGATKNDCERNASKRWIEKFRQHHSKMRTIIIEDSLASNAPHLKVLKDHDCRYIIGAKESDHKYLYEQFNINSQASCTQTLVETSYAGVKVRKKTTRTYEYINDLELNKSAIETKTNFILFKEKIEYLDPPKGRDRVISDKTFTWVTDLT